MSDDEIRLKLLTLFWTVAPNSKTPIGIGDLMRLSEILLPWIKGETQAIEINMSDWTLSVKGET